MFEMDITTHLGFLLHNQLHQALNLKLLGDCTYPCPNPCQRPHKVYGPLKPRPGHELKSQCATPSKLEALLTMWRRETRSPTDATPSV